MDAWLGNRFSKSRSHRRPFAIAALIAALAAVEASGNDVMRPLGDFNPGAADLRPAAFVVLGDRVFFRGIDATAGSEPWTTDGTAAGTQLLLDRALGRPRPPAAH